MKHAIIGILFLGLFLVSTSLISTAHAASTVLTYYDGCWGKGYFFPLDEIVTFDVPAKNLTPQNQYPYMFTLSDPARVYLQIRHFLWAYNEKCSNHLTIWIDNEPVLEVNSPKATSPNGWYPGGDGTQLIDLGTRSAGMHSMTMACNISDYYTVDWWKILLPSSTVPRITARSN